MKTRMLTALLVLITLLAVPACSSTAPPEPTFPVYEPTAAAQARPAVILVPNNIPTSISFEGTIKRLNTALEAKGQHVSFKLRAVSYDSTGTNSFLNQSRKEIAAGQSAADAYALGYIESQGFFNDRLTMDVAELVRQNAPLYFSKYGDIFDDVMSGIPTGLYGKPVWFKTALVLREDQMAAGSGITTLDGLFEYLDKLPAKAVRRNCVLAEPIVLVNQWALEQGYYQLGLYGVDGYLYAALNDPKCTPVPLESIPGLEGFLKTMMQHYADGSLDGNIYTVYSKEPVGIVKNLGDYFISNPYSWLCWIPGEFTAVVLSPELPSIFSEPSYVQDLSIPTSCPWPVAAEVAQFVEWYNGSQENYDVVIYGESGQDFSAAGSRFAPMKEGKEQSLHAITQMQGLFFTWPGAGALSNTEFFRLPQSAPANVEQLYSDALKSGLRPPASENIKFDRGTVDKMLDLSAGMPEIGRARDDALNALIYAAPTSYTDNNYAQAMDALAKVSTGMLVADYQRIIGGFMGK